MDESQILKNNGGTNASIYAAASLGNTEFFKSSIILPEIINNKENNHWTPLHWAAFRNRTNVIKILIENV